MAVDPRFNMSIDRDVAGAEIDAGLRSHMLKVYNLMALGVAFTGLVCFFVASNVQLMAAIRPYEPLLHVGCNGCWLVRT